MHGAEMIEIGVSWVGMSWVSQRGGLPGIALVGTKSGI